MEKCETMKYSTTIYNFLVIAQTTDRQYTKQSKENPDSGGTI